MASNPAKASIVLNSYAAALQRVPELDRHVETLLRDVTDAPHEYRARLWLTGITLSEEVIQVSDSLALRLFRLGSVSTPRYDYHAESFSNFAKATAGVAGSFVIVLHRRVGEYARVSCLAWTQLPTGIKRLELLTMMDEALIDDGANIRLQQWCNKIDFARTA